MVQKTEVIGCQNTFFSEKQLSIKLSSSQCLCLSDQNITVIIANTVSDAAVTSGSVLRLRRALVPTRKHPQCGNPKTKDKYWSFRDPKVSENPSGQDKKRKHGTQRRSIQTYTPFMCYQHSFCILTIRKYMNVCFTNLRARNMAL